jgi:hypothetical protein
MIDPASRDLIPIKVFPQDPWSTPITETVKVRGNILTGPVGSRVAVYDYNRDLNKSYIQAKPGADRTFPDYDPSDLRFHQLNAYAIVVRAIELVEMELGHAIRWGFDASRLIVLPHAGYLANAFYSEDTHSLQFYSFVSPSLKEIYHTCLSHDIVAHETGHAILDAIRDRYTEGLHLETAALHEAVGDLTALFAALSHKSILEKSAGTLRECNLVSDIAEHFGGNHRALRDFLKGALPESYWKNVYSPHDLSLRLSTAIYDALCALQEDRMKSGGQSSIDALKLARRALQRMAVRGLDYLPPADGTFKDYGIAMLKADEFANPGDKLSFRRIAGEKLVEHGILERRDLAAGSGLAGAIWPHKLSFWPRPTAEAAYGFLDKNRKELALSGFSSYRDFVLSEIHYVVPPWQRRERERSIAGSAQTADEAGTNQIEQVIMLYEYPVDIEIKTGGFGLATGKWLTVWGGGTLVFDVDGRMLYHAEKPVTKKRIAEIKKFISDGISKGLAAPMESSREDEIRQYHFNRPWKLALTSDSVVLQSNPAARCYSAREKAGRVK